MNGAALLSPALVVGLLTGLTAGAAAHPSAPPGWIDAAQTAAVAAYTPRDRRDVVLRVWAPARASADLGAWFRARRTRPVDGVALAGFSGEQEQQGVHLAFGVGTRAGAQVLVIAAACADVHGAPVYGELVGPSDQAVLQATLPPALTTLLTACGRAPAGASATEPAGRADHRAGAPTPPARTATAPARKPTAAERAAQFRVGVGQGVADRQVEGILHAWEMSYSFAASSMDHSAWVLLRGGQVRALPPFALDELDAAREQHEAPAEWGRWRRSGDKLQLDWGRGWTTPSNQTLRGPTPPGTRLAGSFSMSSSYGTGFGGSWSTRRLHLTRDGRFERSASGGAGAGGVGADQVVVHTAWDDEGSATAISGPSIGGGSSRRSDKAKADRAGSYSVDGYVLELRYDSGVVERRPTFVLRGRDGLWLGDEVLYLDKK
jgi:hypothetical protein